MDRLVDLIKVYENSIEEDICEYLIELFDNSESKHQRVEQDKKPNFTQFNLTEFQEKNTKSGEVHSYLIRKVYEHRDDYYKFIDERCFPSSHAFEQFRIKKYNTDGNDMFDTHVDVTDHDSSRRFLSFLWYLNDVDDGGETIFKDFEIKPKSGTLIVFPPMWMFPHRGEKPISNTKYILSTYLHYK